VPTGVVGALTALFWAVWIYLVLPLVGLLLWAFGVKLFVRELAEGGYRVLLASLLAYSTVLLALVALLAMWMAWNIVRYGGASDRRTARRPGVTDPEIAAAFRIDTSLLETLRGHRKVRVDLDADDCILLLEGPTAA
jgi:biofilm PGA synthesis protein PgaD